jgi:hypothetical protein
MSVSERREEQEESSPSETEPRKPLFTARSKIIYTEKKESSPADTKPKTALVNFTGTFKKNIKRGVQSSKCGAQELSYSWLQ